MAKKPRTKADVKAAAARAEARAKARVVAGDDAAADKLKTALTGDEPEPDKGGRPTKYKAEYAKTARKLCELGAIDADLAEVFGVNTSTIWRWAGIHAGFCNALKVGKKFADEKVVRALFQRAVGFEHDTNKIMQYEGDPVIIPFREKVIPDTTACIFWLKNRQPKEWRDTQEVAHDVTDNFRDVWAAISKPPAASGSAP